MKKKRYEQKNIASSVIICRMFIINIFLCSFNCIFVMFWQRHLFTCIRADRVQTKCSWYDGGTLIKFVTFSRKFTCDLRIGGYFKLVLDFSKGARRKGVLGRLSVNKSGPFCTLRLFVAFRWSFKPIRAVLLSFEHFCCLWIVFKVNKRGPFGILSKFVAFQFVFCEQKTSFWHFEPLLSPRFRFKWQKSSYWVLSTFVAFGLSSSKQKSSFCIWSPFLTF